MRKNADMVLGNLVSLVLTALIILFIAAFAILLWTAFFSRPDPLEVQYTKNNYERLNEHIDNLIELDMPFDAIVMPYYLTIGYAVVGKGYGGDETVMISYNGEEVEFPRKCKGKACLCLCENLVCNEELCQVFSSRDIRFVIGDADGFCNTNDPINLEDPLDNPTNHLAFLGICSGGGAWQSRNLYVERSKRGNTVFLYIRDFPDDEDAARKILHREEEYMEKYFKQSRCQPPCSELHSCEYHEDEWKCIPKHGLGDFISDFRISGINDDGSILLEWELTELGEENIEDFRIYEMDANYADADEFQDFDYSNQIGCAPERINGGFECTTQAFTDIKRHMFGLRAIDDNAEVLDERTSDYTGEEFILVNYLQTPMWNVDEYLFELAVPPSWLNSADELYQYLTDNIPDYDSLEYGEFLGEIGCVDQHANDPDDYDTHDLWQKKQDLVQVVTTIMFDDFDDVEGIAPRGRTGVLASKIVVDYDVEDEGFNFYGDISGGTSEAYNAIREVSSNCYYTEVGLVISLTQ